MTTFSSAADNMHADFEPAFFTLADMIAVNATTRPRDIAWIEGETQLTWRDFNRNINQLARALRENGLQAGDRVALLGGNTLWAYSVGFSTLRAGGVMCPLSALLTPEMLAQLIVDSGAKILFADRAYLELAKQVCTLSAGLTLVYVGDKPEGGYSYADFVDGVSSADFYHPRRAEDPANIIYSSGTTGTPKGIVHTHGARIGFTHQIAHGCRYTSESRGLVTTAPNSNATWAFIFPLIWLGGSVVTAGSFDAARTIELIAQHRVSHMFIVPTQARAITEYAEAGDADFSSLRCVVTAGAPMPVPLKDTMRALIGENLFELWGFSESVGTIIAPEEMRRRPESVGRAWTGTELRIIDESGCDITGQGPGEIVGRTTSTMCGYLNRDDANREIVWYDEHQRLYLRTGDIGELDDDGYLTLRGRQKDIILSGGLNVFPIDIEKVLLEHEVIVDVAVFAADHEKWGETPVAAVLLGADKSADSAAILAWANSRLAKFQRLSDVVIYSEDFPRNTMGKVQKNELKARYSPACEV